MSYDESLLKPQGRVLSTLEEDGSRRWIYPRLAKGRFWYARRIVAYSLIGIFAIIPYIPINKQGDPLILINLLNRKLHLFGFIFLPTDTVLLALLMIGGILTVFFITALLGRVWCGWACPQTVYMEYIYRPIERFFTGKTGQGGEPKKKVPGWRYALMYGAFLIISMHLANTGLAYFVPYRELHKWIMSPPWHHPVGFMVVMIVTAWMMWDFAYWREQMCIIGCPYGRLQSVLLDRNSLIISYDRTRGEPRGKRKRLSLQVVGTQSLGDCVDCQLCTSVCPTGIDIRDGLQAECVACAQCVDACDGVMDKLGLPRGLIRYSSQAQMSGEKQKIIRPRVVMYGLILMILVSLLVILLITMKPFDLTITRARGVPFVIDPDGQVVNTWILKLTNRSQQEQRLQIRLKDQSDIRIEANEPLIRLAPGQVRDTPVRVIADQRHFDSGHLRAVIQVRNEENNIREKTVLLLGPYGGHPHAVSQ